MSTGKAQRLTTREGQRLAEDWIAAWNSHDLEAILALYASDVVFQTPTIIDTLGIADGRVVGRAALREHFARGLSRLPDLRFELERVYVGVDALAIAYRWHDGTPVCELHEYDQDGLIRRAQALYLDLAW